MSTMIVKHKNRVKNMNYKLEIGNTREEGGNNCNWNASWILYICRYWRRGIDLYSSHYIEYKGGKIKFKQCNTQLQLITFILCSEVLKLYHEVSLYFQSMELMHDNYIMAAGIWKANSNRFKSLGPQQRI